MKLWLRTIAVLLILVMTLTATACGGSESGGTGNPDDTRKNEEGTTGGTPGTGGPNSGGSTPSNPSIPVGYIASFPSAYDADSTSFFYLTRAEYAEDGRVLRETLLSEDFHFLPERYIEHTYEGNSLLRSTLYLIEDSHGIYGFDFQETAYVTYTYNVKGQAVQGILYRAEDNKATDVTVTMEYHDNGILKKTSYLTDGEAYFVTENDTLGRRIKESFEGGVSETVLQYEGNGRKAQSAILKDNECGNTSWDLAYNTSGNMTRLSDVNESNRFLALTYDSAGTAAKLTNVRVSYCDKEVALSYTAKGFVSQVICDENGDRSTYKAEFNAKDLIAKITLEESDGSKSTELFTYNQKDLLSIYTHSVYDKEHKLEMENNYSYTYYNSGKIKTEIFSETRLEERTGELLTSTTKAEYVYDTNDLLAKELLTITEADGSRSEETWYFDTEGTITRTVTKKYDAAGNLISEETNNGGALSPNPGIDAPTHAHPGQTMPPIELPGTNANVGKDEDKEDAGKNENDDNGNAGDSGAQTHPTPEGGQDPSGGNVQTAPSVSDNATDTKAPSVTAPAPNAGTETAPNDPDAGIWIPNP